MNLTRRLEKIRTNKVLPLISGKLLDIGCGNNLLTKRYGTGIGIDIKQYGRVDLVINDTRHLPFDNESFDTITIIATLNHIPYREEVIKECYRLLKPYGQIIITMIPPTFSKYWHILRHGIKGDSDGRQMEKGEVYGMTNKQIHNIMKNKFILVRYESFSLINNLYVYQKKNINNIIRQDHHTLLDQS